MKELQEKIKGMKQNDPRLKELQSEQLRLMKEGNPLGGCLPLLIQMPFLFALYRAITISLDFRQASFLWIPDLSAPEPYLIHVLPILMTGTMVVLQLVTPAPSADPLQRKMMAIGMPLFMLYILWSAPSGLVLYWLVGNIVGFSQQFLINHWTKTDEEVPHQRRRRRLKLASELAGHAKSSFSSEELSMSDTHQEAAEFLDEFSTARVWNCKSMCDQVLVVQCWIWMVMTRNFLQAQTGELLEALQHLINQVFGRSLVGKERLVCDVHGFRATREAELQAMANHAANRVRQTGAAFTFEPMSANERRIIHLTLADSEDLYTESIGEGSDRKLRISRKSSSK